MDTGLPWHTPAPPARPEEPVGPSCSLTEADHIRIADRLRETASVRAIGAELGRSPSTVSAFTVTTDLPVYFCASAGPWQRVSNGNTNGLLRQYLPKGTDLSHHTREDLDAATELNSRLRKMLDWETPAERLFKLLAA